jgi:hypothetical protein
MERHLYTYLQTGGNSKDTKPTIDPSTAMGSDTMGSDEDINPRRLTSEQKLLRKNRLYQVKITKLEEEIKSLQSENKSQLNEIKILQMGIQKLKKK